MTLNGQVRLSEQQLKMVRALNKLGQGGARDVQRQLPELNLAYTTVATVLSRLEKKGVLNSQVKGRERIYQCVVGEETLQKSMVSSLVSSLFNGDSKALLAHLVKDEDFDLAELDDLKQLIKSKTATQKKQTSKTKPSTKKSR